MGEGACTTSGPWHADLCLHGRCSAQGACVCDPGIVDDNLWTSGQRCLMRGQDMRALLVADLLLGVLALGSLVLVCETAASKRRTPVQRTVRMGLASVACYLAWVIANLALQGFRPACQVLLFIAGGIELHKYCVMLAALQHPVDAVLGVAESESGARGLVTSGGRGLFLAFTWTCTAILCALMLVAEARGAQLDSIQVVQFKSLSFWVIQVWVVFLFVSAVALFRQLWHAERRLHHLIAEVKHATPAAEMREKLRALQNRTTASLWAIGFFITGLGSMISVAGGMIALWGVLPFTSVFVLITAPVLPGFQVSVVITARKNVSFWSSRSRASFVRKIVPVSQRSVFAGLWHHDEAALRDAASAATHNLSPDSAPGQPRVPPDSRIAQYH
jgi:hypothetical protein